MKRSKQTHNPKKHTNQFFVRNILGWRDHTLHHELVLVLLVRIEQERLQTDCGEDTFVLVSRIIWVFVCKWRHWNLLDTSTLAPGSRLPEFGRTQYFFGAVVLILNRMFLSVGLTRIMCEVMGVSKGPALATNYLKVRNIVYIISWFPNVKKHFLSTGGPERSSPLEE